MFGETSIRNARRRSLHVVAGITAVGATLVVGSISAAAASGTATPSLPADAGALQIAASSSLALNAPIDLASGSFVSGSGSSATIENGP